ncbi:Zinc finger protein [Gossypium arboreum]|uniref:Zinc finger protein n=1 Tax=Gossypium arboreum TaxID=29729 RepID=A0A0B0NUR3_GOSAR|nr:Zinc finger protein [Gossypium arboreum]
MTTEVAEIMEKLKDKRAGYEATASSDSSVNLDDIDNRVITKVLGPERYGRVRFQGFFISPTQYFGSNLQQYMPSMNQAQAEVQRLRDEMAQMQVSTVEHIAQLKAEAAAREVEAAVGAVEAIRKYDEL